MLPRSRSVQGKRNIEWMLKCRETEEPWRRMRKVLFKRQDGMWRVEGEEERALEERVDDKQGRRAHLMEEKSWQRHMCFYVNQGRKDGKDAKGNDLRNRSPTEEILE